MDGVVNKIVMQKVVWSLALFLIWALGPFDLRCIELNRSEKESRVIYLIENSTEREVGVAGQH